MRKNDGLDINSNSIITAAVLLGDAVLLNILYMVFNLWINGYLVSTSDSHTLVVLTLSYILCALQNGVILYRRKIHYINIALRALRGTVMFALLGGVALLVGLFDIPRLPHLVAFWVSLTVGIVLFRLFVRKLVMLYRARDKNVNHVIFLGGYDNIIALYREMTDSSLMGYKVEGYFDYKPNERFPEECKYLGQPNEALGYLREHNNVSEVYCCLASAHKDDILPVIHYCLHNVKHFYSLPNVSNYLHHRLSLCIFGRVPFFSLYNEPLTRPFNRSLKRLFDFVFSLVFLITIFPIVAIVVAIVTKITMPGPVFFKQKRNGLNGKEFYCYKFRSMRVNEQADTLQATRDDPRKTKWGNIMRMTNIDELPQFINVFLGQMSVVGPRPHMVKQNEDYSQLIDNYMVRHYVKPGITGWSQVSGFRGETRELTQMEGRVDHDIWYIEHWSLPLDIYIIFRTVLNMFRKDKQAY